MKRPLMMLAAGTLLILSCTEIIEIELDSTDRRLVVYGFISTDSVNHQLLLTATSDYFSNSPPTGISHALVRLEYNERVDTLKEHDTVPGLYVVPEPFRGIPGTTYRLQISQVDVDGDGNSEQYGATTSLPRAPQLDSIRLDYFQTPFVSGYQVVIYARDPATRDWYNFRVWKNSDMLTDTLSKFSVQSDDLINGSYIYGLPVGFLRDDLPREAMSPGDTVTVEMNGIEESFYNFILDAQLEIIGNNPLFSGPPANVRSNLDNGALGIFTSFSISRRSVILESGL